MKIAASGTRGKLGIGCLGLIVTFGFLAWVANRDRGHIDELRTKQGYGPAGQSSSAPAAEPKPKTSTPAEEKAAKDAAAWDKIKVGLAKRHAELEKHARILRFNAPCARSEDAAKLCKQALLLHDQAVCAKLLQQDKLYEVSKGDRIGVMGVNDGILKGEILPGGKRSADNDYEDCWITRRVPEDAK